MTDQYQCQYCDATFESVSGLNDHREENHEEKLGA
ncbi:C2H2-type zinc finger protein [Haloarcula nitratireducens]|uniref:C2H2-type zinc finger protein n=1 Tax=Haloarcula nitratireducens TaxID=2487749 RepID=A0AAW4PEM6_9EURY|nr:C2H2-type zinc finger protein [Halomicroarcula nitratireducens]MBX0296409.1 C2H2-type zinc finger protein [Halomicroarcula nitratireducens]